jgi:hypothetical protein
LRYVFAIAWIILWMIGIAMATEAAPMVAEGSAWYKPILDLGIAGTFIAYLIYDRQVELRRKNQENDRWIRLDQQLIDMVEKNTAANMEIAAALKELRASNESLRSNMERVVTVVATGTDHRRRLTDDD